MHRGPGRPRIPRSKGPSELASESAKRKKREWYTTEKARISEEMSSKRVQLHHRELLAYLKWKAKDRMHKWRDKTYLPFIEARTFVR